MAKLCTFSSSQQCPKSGPDLPKQHQHTKPDQNVQTTKQFKHLNRIKGYQTADAAGNTDCLLTKFQFYFKKQVILIATNKQIHKGNTAKTKAFFLASPKKIQIST